jgi:hypothetical protein
LELWLARTESNRAYRATTTPRTRRWGERRDWRGETCGAGEPRWRVSLSRRLRASRWVVSQSTVTCRYSAREERCSSS